MRRSRAGVGGVRPQKKGPSPIETLRFGLIASLLGALVILAAAPAAASSYQRVSLGEGPDLLRLYLGADNTGTKGSLSLNAPSGGADAFVGPPASGPQAALGRMAGSTPAPFEFQLETGLSRAYWLDLAKPIVGVLYWQSKASQYAQHDDVFVRIELWVGSDFAGGDWQPFSVTTAQVPWTPLYVKFRPEVAQFPRDAMITVKVFEYTGLADFSIGTGGTHQSVLEARVFDSDPLAGALYVSGVERQLYFGDAPDDAGGSLDGSEAGAVAVLLSAAPMLVPLARRGRALRLVFTALLGAALSGCANNASGPADASAGPGAGSASPGTEAPVEATLVSDPTLHGEGAIEGVVRDSQSFGVGIGAATVTLVGTSLASTTNREGAFAFGNVTAGSYRLRAEASGFAEREAVVSVVGGKRTQVDVPLSRLDTGGTIHPHDDWEGKLVRPLFEAPAMFPSYVVGLGRSGVAGTGHWVNPSAIQYYILAPVAVPEDVVVLAGTTEVTLTLDWTRDPGAPRELGLKITTTGNQTDDQIYLAREPNVPFRIAIFPNEADPGHQKYTDWTFQVARVADRFDPAGSLGGEITVHATIKKGVVPLEPIHPDPWGNETQLTLFDKKPYVSCNCGGGNTNGWADGEVFPSMSVWVPGRDQFVPASTKHIRGTFSVIIAGNLTGLSLLGYGAGVPFPRPVTWNLVYHPGNEPITKAVWKRVPDVAITGTGTVSFTMSVPDDEVDPFYAATSRWRFSPEHDAFGETRPYLYESPKGTRFELSITVERDERP